MMTSVQSGSKCNSVLTLTLSTPSPGSLLRSHSSTMSASSSSYQRLPQAEAGDAEPLLADSQYPAVQLSRQQAAEADKGADDGDTSLLLGQSSSSRSTLDDDVPHNATT